jgi:hypothetical protein
MRHMKKRDERRAQPFLAKKYPSPFRERGREEGT